MDLISNLDNLQHYLVRLWIPIHEESACSEQQVTELSTWRLVVIYIRYWSAVESLQQDVESTSKFDFKGASTPMGPSGLHSELIFFDDMIYKGWMGFQFAFMHKGVLVIMQGCTRISEQYL